MVIGRGEIENYMYGSLMGVKTEMSFGCGQQLWWVRLGKDRLLCVG